MILIDMNSISRLRYYLITLHNDDGKIDLNSLYRRISI
ncbi:unnamed protein product [Paramecium octaurelia]|uniref:Uncharacterized protein n=1 Tax=Paramecium octaurelia TaxID=43137 RepID=A0A8S1TS11_PAROT|nr:unnamed protein product [Paramecium octaurelia]